MLATRCAWARGRQVSGRCAWQVRGRERSRSLDSILAEVRSRACALFTKHSSLLQLTQGEGACCNAPPRDTLVVWMSRLYLGHTSFWATVCSEFESLTVFSFQVGERPPLFNAVERQPVQDLMHGIFWAEAARLSSDARVQAALRQPLKV